MQGSTQMFVDVSTPDGHVTDWPTASKCILECADRAEKLLARSACCSHSLVYHQVLALVEHYFLRVLPVPTPAQVWAAESTCPHSQYLSLAALPYPPPSPLV